MPAGRNGYTGIGTAPVVPRRPCLVCGRPGEGSYCPEHNPEPGRRAAKSNAYGYGRAHWRNLRKRVLTARTICELQHPGCTITATSVHLLPYMGGNHDAATEADVLAACHHCHGVEDQLRSVRRE